jgi:hypothetical protein
MKATSRRREAKLRALSRRLAIALSIGVQAGVWLKFRAIWIMRGL